MNRAYTFVIITAFLFGSMEVSCKIGGADLDPFQLTFIRFAIGGLVLLPFAYAQKQNRKIKLTGKDILKLAGVGTIGVPVSMVLFQMSIMLSNASTVAVLICTTPFFTMIFAHLFTAEKLNRRKLIVLAIAAAAIFFMLRPWDVQEGNTMGGMLLMLLAAVFFGLYTVTGAMVARRIGPIVQTSGSFILGSAVLLVVILLMGRPVVTGVMDDVPIVIYVGVFVTGIGYYCYFRAIELSDAATGSIVFFLKPAIAAALAWMILHETILWNSFLGIGLILAASLINILGQKQEMNQARAEDRRIPIEAQKQVRAEEEAPGGADMSEAQKQVRAEEEAPGGADMSEAQKQARTEGEAPGRETTAPAQKLAQTEDAAPTEEGRTGWEKKD